MEGALAPPRGWSHLMDHKVNQAQGDFDRAAGVARAISMELVGAGVHTHTCWCCSQPPRPLPQPLMLFNTCLWGRSLVRTNQPSAFFFFVAPRVRRLRVAAASRGGRKVEPPRVTDCTLNSQLVCKKKQEIKGGKDKICSWM